MPKLIHVMFRVLDLERSLSFYSTAFGFEPSQRLDFEDFTLVYLRNPENDMEIELTWNRDRTEPYEPGAAYGHTAFAVDDLDAEHARFTNAGLEPDKIVDFSPDGQLIARFFFCTDPDGYRIEILQRHGHYQ